MREIFFVLVLITGLLVFGCVGGPSETQTQPSTTQQPGGTTTPATGEQPGQPATEPATQEPPPATGEVDYSGMAYAALIATGNPVECDVRISSQGMVYTAKMYIVGENKMRMEWDYAGQKSEAIIVDDVTYVKLDDPYAGCEWISMEGSAAEGGETPEAGTSMHATVPDLESMASTNFDCRAWIYDGSKFAIPSNVCTSEEFTERILEGMQNPEGYQ